MFAGFLKEKIEIYGFQKTRNEYGEEVEERTLLYTTRAKVGHVGGSRSVINSEIQTPYTKRFVLRIYVPIYDDSWIKYKDKYYRVTSIDKDLDMQQQVIDTEIVNE